MFEVETIKVIVEWGGFTAMVKAPENLVVLGAADQLVTTPGAVPLVPLTPRGEDVSATSIDTSAL